MQTDEERRAEYAKAEADRALFGMGAVHTDRDGNVRHVPSAELSLLLAKPPTGDEK